MLMCSGHRFDHILRKELGRSIGKDFKGQRQQRLARIKVAKIKGLVDHLYKFDVHLLHAHPRPGYGLEELGTHRV